MMTEQLYLGTGRNKIEEAIARIKQYEPPEGYILAFSGGKDSVVLLDLARRSSCKFELHYDQTGIDPPELVQFIRHNFPGVVFIKPLMTMWRGIEVHGLPLRQRRWCCQLLKEHDGANRTILQGVRWAESSRRRRRWNVFTEFDPRIGSKSGSEKRWFCNPIIDWSDNDVWSYIRGNNLAYCSLYNQGFKRLGCVLCPFSAGEELKMELARYPKIADAYRRAACRYIERRQKETGFQRFVDGNEYYNWWIEERLNPAKRAAPCGYQGMLEFEW